MHYFNKSALDKTEKTNRMSNTSKTEIVAEMKPGNTRKIMQKKEEA